MSLALSISPHGRLLLERNESEAGPSLGDAIEKRIEKSFLAGPAHGLLHLATAELRTALPATLSFARSVGQRYLTRLSRERAADGAREIEPVSPSPEELALLVEQAPPMKGLEYLTADVISEWWTELDRLVREEIRKHEGGAGAYLREKNPLWHLVGRVTFHLAENKRDEQHPFAFLATYASRLSEQGSVQHLPLSRALPEYARDRQALLGLLTPIQRAAEASPWIADLVESNSIYQPLAWTPNEAHRFLQDIPLMENSGLVVRVPDWWKSARPPRPQVSVSIGNAAKSFVGMGAILDFNVEATLAGQAVSAEELQQLLESTGHLVRVRGQWVEIDREKLAEALEHWNRVKREVRGGGLTFFEGMRLLSGAGIDRDAAGSDESIALKEWTGIQPGPWLAQTLEKLRDPARLEANARPKGLRAELRPYQQVGVNWLQFMAQLGLGACLADDMGLGKTIQVLALLLHLREGAGSEKRGPSLLVVPASLIANWKAEIARFAPELDVWVAHPSESERKWDDAEAMAKQDLVITTYGMLARLESLREKTWNLVILDEAQAVKNSGTRQTRAVKQVRAAGRLALTGTPIENRLSDLWSLFDFLNPGLLGSAKAFSKYVKAVEKRGEGSYAPLRSLVRPYILRRLKTDKRVIADLPEKTEVKVFCGLSKEQAAVYMKSVAELQGAIEKADGIKRRGLVLAYLMRLKQICNHPSQWLGDMTYDPKHSGKFQRLAELCEELAERQEKALIFTQFREISGPLSEFLQSVYGRAGLVLHGGTPLPKRKEMVAAFQRDEGPPFFVLSLKAGGTGLNLTTASQVIHFDRWWNPAVENQATDRAFRIGQKKNVIVHKFVCRGTLEEKIDKLISEKSGLSQDLLDEGAEKMLTEMDDRELLRFVSLDVNKATEE